jgi:alpha-tubulin suppressor-like RCC1 family protein
VRTKPVLLVLMLILSLVVAVSSVSGAETEQREAAELSGTIKTVDLIQEYIDRDNLLFPIENPTTVVDLGAPSISFKRSNTNELTVFLDGYKEIQEQNDGKRIALVFARLTLLKSSHEEMLNIVNGHYNNLSFTVRLIDDRGEARELSYYNPLYNCSYLKEQPVVFWGSVEDLSTVVRIDFININDPNNKISIKNLKSLPERTIHWEPCLVIDDFKVLMNHTVVTSIGTEVNLTGIQFPEMIENREKCLTLTFTVTPQMDKSVKVNIVVDEDESLSGSYEEELYEGISRKAQIVVPNMYDAPFFFKDLPLDITVIEKDATGKEVVTVKQLLLPLTKLTRIENEKPYTVSGQVIDEATGQGLPGVTLSFDSYGTTVTYSQGNWVKYGLKDAVTITPTSPGWVFTPETLTVSKETKDLLIKANPALPIKLAAGEDYTVALKNDGTIWAWGRNDEGQLGDGTKINKCTPLKVSGLTDVIAIAARGRHTVALKKDGTVWTWGRNYYGQLGDGSRANRNTPAQVSNLNNVTTIAAGGLHTVALKNDGTVWTWGRNDLGQLGDGTTTDRYTPVQVSGLSSIVAIAAGGSHTVALKNDGSVWAWGNNEHGQLGDGTTTNRYIPVQVNGLRNVVTIAVGLDHTVALKNDRSVWAWGCNLWGQLGDGSRADRNTPVLISAVSNLTAITGSYHTVALKNDGTVWTWGRDGSGQLGNGRIGGNAPIQVSDLRDVIAIAAGTYHTGAIKNDGTIWVWGYNYMGSLGDGTVTDQYTPVQVVKF